MGFIDSSSAEIGGRAGEGGSRVAQLECDEDDAINDLVVSIESLVQGAVELRTQKNRQQNPGTGLQPNNRWAEFANPYQK